MNKSIFSDLSPLNFPKLGVGQTGNLVNISVQEPEACSFVILMEESAGLLVLKGFFIYTAAGYSCNFLLFREGNAGKIFKGKAHFF